MPEDEVDGQQGNFVFAGHLCFIHVHDFDLSERTEFVVTVLLDVDPIANARGDMVHVCPAFLLLA
jgi:hypothetical protein